MHWLSTGTWLLHNMLSCLSSRSMQAILFSPLCFSLTSYNYATPNISEPGTNDEALGRSLACSAGEASACHTNVCEIEFVLIFACVSDRLEADVLVSYSLALLPLGDDGVDSLAERVSEGEADCAVLD